MALSCGASVRTANRYVRGVPQRLAKDYAWRSFFLLLTRLFSFFAVVALPLPFRNCTHFCGVAAVFTPRGDVTVCSNEVMSERVTIALSSAPFGSGRCTTHRITACDLQQGLTILMPPEPPPMSAFRPLLRVFIEGSVLLRHNIAGNLATLEVVSGVPSGAGPATDPSQYYSFELTILSTVISASVTDVTDPEVMKEGAFAFSIAGIFLAHSIP